MNIKFQTYQEADNGVIILQEKTQKKPPLKSMGKIQDIPSMPLEIKDEEKNETTTLTIQK